MGTTNYFFLVIPHFEAFYSLFNAKTVCPYNYNNEQLFQYVKKGIKLNAKNTQTVSVSRSLLNSWMSLKTI